jgi:hypothetical protein
LRRGVCAAAPTQKAKCDFLGHTRGFGEKGVKSAKKGKKIRQFALTLVQLLSDREARTYMGNAQKTVPFWAGFPRIHLDNMQIK